MAGCGPCSEPLPPIREITVTVLYFLIPLAGLLVAGAVLAFFAAARDGQFDDLDTPALRVLFDDAAPAVKRTTSTPEEKLS